MNELTINQAVQNIDTALASISANRETHALLVVSLKTIQQKAVTCDELAARVKELEQEAEKQRKK